MTLITPECQSRMCDSKWPLLTTTSCCWPSITFMVAELVTSVEATAASPLLKIQNRCHWGGGRVFFLLLVHHQRDDLKDVTSKPLNDKWMFVFCAGFSLNMLHNTEIQVNAWMQAAVCSREYLPWSPTKRWSTPQQWLQKTCPEIYLLPLYAPQKSLRHGALCMPVLWKGGGIRNGEWFNYFL